MTLYLAIARPDSSRIGDVVGAGRAGGELVCERERLLIELGVWQHAVDDALLGECRRWIRPPGEYGLDCAAGTGARGARGEPVGATDDRRQPDDRLSERELGGV
ncbi:MAG TPA: hypothetical protein VGP18_11040 [Solirubrobacteraceae bacterium]|jgi:hypothetical protein|nr:hypothetical protein [Solirubrobacteraceae bacterium]